MLYLISLFVKLMIIFGYFSQWLTDTFLPYLHDWQHESDDMDNLTKEEKKRFCLSLQTLEGLRITGMW